MTEQNDNQQNPAANPEATPKRHPKARHVSNEFRHHVPTNSRGATDPRTGKLATRSEAKRKRALAAIAQVPTLTAGAEAAGISRSTLAVWIQDDPEFRAEVEAAIASAVDRLEAHAFSRAQGHDGKSPSDLLTIFLMKGHRHQYRDRIEHQHTGEIRHEIVIDLVPAPAALPAGAVVIDAVLADPTEKYLPAPRTAPEPERLPPRSLASTLAHEPADSIDTDDDR
jgi:hypothetical protein